MKKWQKYLREGLFWLVIAAALTGCVPTVNEGGGSQKSNPASSFNTSFKLFDINGKEVNFPEDFSGRKVALVFFSTS